MPYPDDSQTSSPINLISKPADLNLNSFINFPLTYQLLNGKLEKRGTDFFGYLPTASIDKETEQSKEPKYNQDNSTEDDEEMIRFIDEDSDDY